jgi:hypothetical protein
VGTSYGNELSFTTLAPPTVTTTAISNIAATTATSGGNVTSQGGAAVTSRGLVWGTSPGSTTFSATSGSGTGTYSISLSSLSASTTYYVRAFATSSVGTSYGSELSFTTLAAPTAPTLNATTTVTSITASTATSGGSVTSTGGTALTAVGVCWSTSQNPTTANSNTNNGTATSFTSNLTGLTAGTTYYVRAYATNSVGTSYGSQVSFVTSASSALKLHYDINNTACYSGSGNTLTDLSGNSNHGTLENSPTYTTLTATTGGKALLFNGTNQYISTSYTPSNTCTISIWFYNNANYNDANRGIFSTYNTVGGLNGTMGLYMATYNQGLNLSRDGNIGYAQKVTPTLNTNTWYNVTVTSDPTQSSNSGAIKVYVNGVLETTITGKTTHADVLNIGRSRYNSNYWPGYIGNFMVYNTVFSDTDVLNNFNSQKTLFGY